MLTSLGMARCGSVVGLAVPVPGALVRAVSKRDPQPQRPSEAEFMQPIACNAMKRWRGRCTTVSQGHC